MSSDLLSVVRAVRLIVLLVFFSEFPRSLVSFKYIAYQKMLPNDILNVIMDYKSGIEHYERYKHVLENIRQYYVFEQFCRCVIEQIPEYILD